MIWAYTGRQKELLAHTKEVIEGLEPEYQKVIDMTPEHVVLVPGLHFHMCLVDELPAGRVTLLGDAARRFLPPIYDALPSLKANMLFNTRCYATLPRRGRLSGHG
jgi:hypothetical protein